MKKIILIALALCLAAFASAQTAVGDPNPNDIGVDTAQQKLKEVSVDKFEAAGFWKAFISPDEGAIQYRLFEGSPAGKAFRQDRPQCTVSLRQRAQVQEMPWPARQQRRRPSGSNTRAPFLIRGKSEALK